MPRLLVNKNCVMLKTILDAPARIVPVWFKSVAVTAPPDIVTMAK